MGFEFLSHFPSLQCLFNCILTELYSSFCYSFIHSPHYTGGTGCKYCNPNRDAAAMFVDWGHTDTSLVAWEKQFEAMLKKGPHSAFNRAKKCDITMTIQDTVADNMKKVDAATPALRGFTTAQD
jgi:hypothetical protein